MFFAVKIDGKPFKEVVAMATLSKLKELMSIPGAVAAGEFSDDGRLLAYYGNIDKKSAEVRGRSKNRRTRPMVYNLSGSGMYVSLQFKFQLKIDDKKKLLQLTRKQSSAIRSAYNMLKDKIPQSQIYENLRKLFSDLPTKYIDSAIYKAKQYPTDKKYAKVERKPSNEKDKWNTFLAMLFESWESKNHFPYTVELKLRNGEVYGSVSFGYPEPEIWLTREYGVIGIDTNASHKGIWCIILIIHPG